jgi:hypothetical protein
MIKFTGLRPVTAYQQYALYCEARQALARKIGLIYCRCEPTLNAQVKAVYEKWEHARNQFIQSFHDCAQNVDEVSRQEILWGLTSEAFNTLHLKIVPVVAEVIEHLGLVTSKFKGVQ